MTTVLVVDDHPELREIIVQFLRLKRYQVHDVRTGEAAIEMLDRASVDAVIADLYLPGKVNGVDVLVQHRKVAPKGCRILLTAALLDNLRSVCKYIDANYLSKPFQLDELIQIIENSLGQIQD